MHIDLAKIIKCDGADRSFEYELNLNDFDLADSSRLDGSVFVTGSIRNISGSLFLSLSAKAILQTNCDRCLESFICPVSFADEYEVSMEETDDFNVVVPVNGIIDLDQVVTENLFLSVPMKKLCKDDCKGLCPTCGANLNKVTCSCTKEEIDPRLEALKDLLK